MWFHGSPNKILNFDHPISGKNYGEGIYLTASEEEAIQYALKSDKSGYVYMIAVFVSNPFDVTNKNHAELIMRELKLSKKKYEANEFDYICEDCGYSNEDSYNYFARISSMLIASGVSSRESDSRLIDCIRDCGFDAIIDTIKNWLIVQDPALVKIVQSKRIKINDYDFVGEPGEMKFVKK